MMDEPVISFYHADIGFSSKNQRHVRGLLTATILRSYFNWSGIDLSANEEADLIYDNDSSEIRKS